MDANACFALVYSCVLFLLPEAFLRVLPRCLCALAAPAAMRPPRAPPRVEGACVARDLRLAELGVHGVVLLAHPKRKALAGGNPEGHHQPNGGKEGATTVNKNGVALQGVHACVARRLTSAGTRPPRAGSPPCSTSTGRGARAHPRAASPSRGPHRPDRRGSTLPPCAASGARCVALRCQSLRPGAIGEEAWRRWRRRRRTRPQVLCPRASLSSGHPSLLFVGSPPPASSPRRSDREEVEVAATAPILRKSSTLLLHAVSSHVDGSSFCARAFVIVVIRRRTRCLVPPLSHHHHHLPPLQFENPGK